MAALLAKLNDEQYATVHWAMTPDEQMALCEAMFTSMGFLEEFQISPEALRAFLCSIKAQYKGTAATNIHSAAQLP